MSRVSIILGVLVSVGCSSKLTSELASAPTQAVLFFRDKDGVYQFDSTTSEEKVIFKATEIQIFREGTCKVINDTLTFALKGNLTFDNNEKYFDNYITVDLKSGHSWLSHRTVYEKVSNDSLKVTLGTINDNGVFTPESQTLERFRCASYTYKGPTYNEPRFYSTSTVGDKTVFSLEGNLYLVEKLDTTVLINYKGEFDSKFGSGYYEPQISPSGQFVIFRYIPRYAPGYKGQKEKLSLQRINLSTRDVTKIKDGAYGSPTFSKDGNFLLFARNLRKKRNDTWLSEIYTLDLRTNIEQKIGEANMASWK